MEQIRVKDFKAKASHYLDELGKGKIIKVRGLYIKRVERPEDEEIIKK